MWGTFLSPKVLPIVFGLIFVWWKSLDRMDGCCPALNWEHRYGLLASEIIRPDSLDSVTAAVAYARQHNKQINVVGSGHAWGDAAMPAAPAAPSKEGSGSAKNGTVSICMRCYSGLVAVDREEMLVTVLGGTTLRQLIDILAEYGWALEVFPSINEQTIAGAIATGTHGTGMTHGNMATLVPSFELVTASGEVRTVSAKSEPDLFYGGTIGLGLLGIVTKVTLQAVPAYNLHEQKSLISNEEFYARFDSITSQDSYVKFWKEEHSEKVLVYAASVSADEPRGNPIHLVEDIKMYIFESILYVTAWFPSTVSPCLRFLCHYANALPPGERVNVWHKVLNLPGRLPLHPEVEYAVPVSQAGDALRYVTEYIQTNNIPVNMVSEIRPVAGDKFWMSNEYDRLTCHITLLIYGQDAVFTDYTDGIERGFAERDIQYRPHWGKMFGLVETDLSSYYPKWDDFVALKKRLDPNGMFCNAQARRVFNESKIC